MQPLVYGPDDIIVIDLQLCFMSPLIDTKRTVKNYKQKFSRMDYYEIHK